MFKIEKQGLFFYQSNEYVRKQRLKTSWKIHRSDVKLNDVSNKYDFQMEIESM